MAAVKHCGEVIRIEGNSVFVRMTVNSACSACHAKGVCGVSESTEKIVEVETASAADFNIGESVEVALLSDSMGAKSVVLAYVVPFLVLTLMLVGSLMMGAGEGVAVLSALGGVAIYYVVLHLLRDKVKNKIKFIIIKQTK
ncbi:MAG: SoxR reducing system RseC family protein [Alistipes sp.]|jgi:sigma-E factor negative regulatory protein RseC|nr:SoxR reducing system RseC family protein [Alistipes sp.]